MRGSELLEQMALVEMDYVMAAEEMPKRRKKKGLTGRMLAACLCLGVLLTVPALAAVVPAWYDALYAISPATAQLFQPVRLSCEENGIRMEVIAVHIQEDTAEIYLSLQDLTQERLDSTIDLFDSYGIRTPFDCSGDCKMISFDPQTQTALFLLTITQWGGQEIQGDKLTFTLRELLCKKETFEGVISQVNLAEAEQNPAVQYVEPRGWSGETSPQEMNGETLVTVLQPRTNMASPVQGVTVTGVGYIEGVLHVQVYYESILETDNHGFLSLYEVATGERIGCAGSVAFYDEEGKGSYEDYLFPGITTEEIKDFELYGEFVTAPDKITGNWRVTVPLREMNQE